MRKIYKDLLKTFQDKKLQIESNATYNMNQALNIEDIKNSYNKCNSLIIEIAKTEYNNKDSKKLKEEFKKEKENLHKILAKNNINPKSLKPQYSCKICKDEGMINGQFCDCFKKAFTLNLLKESGLSDKNLPDFNNITFDIITNEKQKKQYVAMCDKLKNFVSKLKNNEKKNITMFGGVGVGKTYLLQAVVNEAIKNNYYTVYTTAFNLNNDMLKYHCAGLDEKADILQKYIDADLLCIDDLGTENILRNVTVEYLYLIINERLQLNRATIITTNLTLQQIMETYDERIFSRIANKTSCYLFNLQGDDLRLKK